MINWSEILDLEEVLLTLLYWVVTLGLAGLLMIVFELFTPYKDREELLAGNVAVGAQFAGKIIGLGIITEASIAHNVSLIGAAVWIVIGYILMLIGYYVFELITPFKIEDEIKKGNVAIGVLVASVSIFIGFAVSGSIT
ncbi:DUF350 domain-containing protein [Filobacillus milosensis]|uniref:DUF350 domain-containing protein n=1 Tax=Filobacillus milosensis TaxID=94137 RepID=A0A4Y8ITH6_9BACI|nr:DUF350 domain-containing protein [Filobacillus milosensis]TFB25112.1 DUF350 domain-containing protein [Filobacillus milosensis]